MLEMSVLANELLKSELGRKVKFIAGPAAMMTSLGMQGFSVSVCALDEGDEELLKASTPLSAWPPVQSILPAKVMPLSDGISPIKAMPSPHPATKAFLISCCETLIAAERDLNALDAKSGDGDTGSTLANASRALIADVDKLPLADQTQLYRAIGQELSQTMGGSSGVLLAIFFTAAGDASSSGLPLQKALQKGLERMQQIGGANLGDRTMVDALSPALKALGDGIGEAAKAARAGAEHTATLTKANAGRASYVSAEHLGGHVDPGAEAVARLFERIAG